MSAIVLHGVGALGDCTDSACVTMEGVFTRLKLAAETAKWPPAFSPAVVQVDKEWQVLRKADSPNLAAVASLQLRAELLIAQLNATIKGIAVPTSLPPPKTVGPPLFVPPVLPPAPPSATSWTTYALYGGGAVAVLTVIAAVLVSRRRPALAGSRRRLR